MSSKTRLLFTVAAFIVLVAGITWYIFQTPRGPEVEVLLRKSEYNKKETLQLKITNNLSESICFSSCYPYRLERKAQEEWQQYQYDQCPWQDVNKKCIEPKGIKAFELSLNGAAEGTHRLVIPICKNCIEGESFKEIEKIYSSIFKIH